MNSTLMRRTRTTLDVETMTDTIKNPDPGYDMHHVHAKQTRASSWKRRMLLEQVDSTVRLT